MFGKAPGRSVEGSGALIAHVGEEDLLTVWLNRAGSHREFEQKFIQDNRIYVTWDRLDVDRPLCQHP